MANFDDKVKPESVYRHIGNALTSQECQDIVDLWPTLKHEPALVYNDRNPEHEEPRTRVGEIALCNFYEIPHFKKIIHHIQQYNLDQKLILNGNYEVQFARYTPGSHFTKHQDVSIKLWSRLKPYDTRKISLSIQLSDDEDYEGGDFQFFTEKSEKGSRAINMSRKKGTMFLFPSYCEHLVTEVTKGERFSLVIWARGPFWV